MKRNIQFILALLSAVVILNSCKKEAATPVGGNEADNVPETKPAIQTAVSADITANIGGFYKALPARYDSTTKKYPLLVFLHGVAETGNGTTDLYKVLANSVPKLLSQKTFPPQFTVNGANYSFIVINPQFKEWPQPGDVNAIINYAIKNLRVDTTRIYVSGLSMGAGATWDYAIAYPNRIAAIVPISGASWPSNIQCGNMAKANLPVWAFHNNNDSTVAVTATNTIVDYINSFNPSIPAKKTIWATGGHNELSKATNPTTKECDGKNMYEWMLQYSRKVLAN
jgi:predicted peptidase